MGQWSLQTFFLLLIKPKFFTVIEQYSPKILIYVVRKKKKSMVDCNNTNCWWVFLAEMSEFIKLFVEYSWHGERFLSPVGAELIHTTNLFPFMVIFTHPPTHFYPSTSLPIYPLNHPSMMPLACAPWVPVVSQALLKSRGTQQEKRLVGFLLSWREMTKFHKQIVTEYKPGLSILTPMQPHFLEINAKGQDIWLLRKWLCFPKRVQPISDLALHY